MCRAGNPEVNHSFSPSFLGAGPPNLSRHHPPTPVWGEYYSVPSNGWDCIRAHLPQSVHRWGRIVGWVTRTDLTEKGLVHSGLAGTGTVVVGVVPRVYGTVRRRL